jgi:hypothetical protein
LSGGVGWCPEAPNFSPQKDLWSWEMLVYLRVHWNMCDVALLVYLGETVVNCGVYQTFWEAPFSGDPERRYTQVDGNLYKMW